MRRFIGPQPTFCGSLTPSAALWRGSASGEPPIFEIFEGRFSRPVLFSLKIGSPVMPGLLCHAQIGAFHAFCRVITHDAELLQCERFHASCTPCYALRKSQYFFTPCHAGLRPSPQQEGLRFPLCAARSRLQTRLSYLLPDRTGFTPDCAGIRCFVHRQTGDCFPDHDALQF